MSWYERIIFKGGPLWAGDYIGAADLALIQPVDTVTAYPNGDYCCEYVRTNQGWVSPLYGTVHTIFELRG